MGRIEIATKEKYRYLGRRPGKRTRELFVVDTGVRASAIWHDRYVYRLAPVEIARDRDIPVEAVYEALAYCRDNWEKIYRAKDLEKRKLEKKGFLKPDRE